MALSKKNMKLYYLLIEAIFKVDNWYYLRFFIIRSKVLSNKENRS